MKRKFCSITSSEVKKFLPSDFMKNQVTRDLKKREQKTYVKLKTTLKDALVPLKSK